MLLGVLEDCEKLPARVIGLFFCCEQGIAVTAVTDRQEFYVGIMPLASQNCLKRTKR